MLSKLFELKKVLGASDSGNTSNKFSYIDKEGNIRSFVIPSVIAEAGPNPEVDMGGSSKVSLPKESKLHVTIKSDALPNGEKVGHYYVGEYAKFADEYKQPNGEAEDKHNNKLHTITTLTGFALMAWELGMEEINIPYYGGLPIEEYRRVGPNAVLDRIKGVHEVTGVDGEFKGKTALIKIEEGEVHPEGVTSSLGLGFDIKNGEMFETTLENKIGENFAITDLGAGTLDTAIYDVDGLNSKLSGNKKIGTNRYIDRILERIELEVEAFVEVKKDLESTGTYEPPYRTREEFMRTVIIPEVSKMIKMNKEGQDYEPRFYADWLWETGEDISEIVKEEMENYYNEVVKEIYAFWSSARTKTFVIVGGGLLFAYYKFREPKNQKRFLYPPNLEQANFFTSRAYLISNYMDHAELIQA
ncbi:ParM/StbA family protein [Desertibacillus haloalkaliphilus]|uniref:ParM/StbA family protein n=1 Tax=Desertibacillus haloalkaliphilus TaxID=1328930 RepID=UPI001C2708E5|nr:ParM/StbA family protein [Desertibacillus haloalkaliphilus]MBU8908068.1 ParM/StbA family protein [Desertibacillus haloalkaliphilus]